MPISGEKFVDVGGVRTRYFERGSGEVVVLVHGGAFGSTTGACCADDWDLNFDGLARWFRVFAIDKLGQGYTDNPRTDDDYTMHAAVQHAYATLRALGIEGSASGGPFARRLSRLQAHRRASGAGPELHHRRQQHLRAGNRAQRFRVRQHAETHAERREPAMGRAEILLQRRPHIGCVGSMPWSRSRSSRNTPRRSAR